MAVVGADAVELRATAHQFTQAADRLEASLTIVEHAIQEAGSWRGPDAERFRGGWRSRNTGSIQRAVALLRSGADVLRRNADEQVDASRADGAIASSSSSAAGGHRPIPRHLTASSNTSDMWKQIADLPNGANTSGYRIQQIVGSDGETRYVVYIGGTDASAAQTWPSNYGAARGQLDRRQLDRLKALIPPGKEVMLVGYSQGGIDAQNIAKSGELNVKQIVTFGSPARPDIDVPAVHLRAIGDPVPASGTGLAVGGMGLGALSGVGGLERGIAMTANPYALSAVESGAHNQFFNAGVGFNGLNAVDCHVKGYSNVSAAYDSAVTRGDAGRYDNSDRFEGTAMRWVDITADGKGDWKS